MEKLKYRIIVDNNTPKEPIMYNAIIAFLTGGLMGTLGQALIDIYSYYTAASYHQFRSFFEDINP